jgi:hypothetical protein
MMDPGIGQKHSGAGMSRRARELRTLEAMIRCYCRDHHPGAGESLCSACQDLLAYAARRLARCCYEESKPTCNRCPIHCYAPVQRSQVREVMRHAGPRILWQHPVLALWHWLDGLRRVPKIPPSRAP